MNTPNYNKNIRSEQWMLWRLSSFDFTSLQASKFHQVIERFEPLALKKKKNQVLSKKKNWKGKGL